LTIAGPTFSFATPRLDGVVAQLVEHHNGIVGVRSSNLLGSTILNANINIPRLCAVFVPLLTFICADDELNKAAFG
jgi:hypothetical protein